MLVSLVLECYRLEFQKILNAIDSNLAFGNARMIVTSYPGPYWLESGKYVRGACVPHIFPTATAPQANKGVVAVLQSIKLTRLTVIRNCNGMFVSLAFSLNVNGCFDSLNKTQEQ